MPNKFEPYPPIGNDFRGPFTPCEVASFIVSLPKPDKVFRIGLVKLSILIYIAHGWLLGAHDKPLVDEQAKPGYGPDYDDLSLGAGYLFKQRKLPNRKTLARDLFKSTWEGGKARRIDSECAEAIHIRFICGRYGGHSPEALVSKTNAPGTPCSISREEGSGYISDELINTYYKEAFGSGKIHKE